MKIAGQALNDKASVTRFILHAFDVKWFEIDVENWQTL